MHLAVGRGGAVGRVWAPQATLIWESAFASPKV